MSRPVLCAYPIVLVSVTHASGSEKGAIAVISERDAKRFSVILPLNVMGFWTPSAGDVEKMDRAIVKRLETRAADSGLSSREREKAKQVMAEFGSCWRQYNGIVVDGERRIFCNAGIGARPVTLGAEPAIVLDGGAAFWRIQYVPSTDRCTSFNTNREA